MDYVNFQTAFANILQPDPGAQVRKQIEKELKVCMKNVKFLYSLIMIPAVLHIQFLQY